VVDFLPFYHMACALVQTQRSADIELWLVNGTNQAEATNGFKTSCSASRHASKTIIGM